MHKLDILSRAIKEKSASFIPIIILIKRLHTNIFVVKKGKKIKAKFIRKYFEL